MHGVSHSSPEKNSENHLSSPLPLVEEDDLSLHAVELAPARPCDDSDNDSIMGDCDCATAYVLGRCIARVVRP